ncbi:MAG: methyltransferase [Sulfuricella sp.]|nr:methyltransferase [Sulfuricella sp.]
MTTKIKRQFFAPCPRGLEAILAAELKELGAADLQPTDGGVGFSGTLALAYRANLHSRFASRILWRLVEKPYRSEDDVYRAALDIAWPELFAVGNTVRVDVSAIKCPLKSLDFLVLKIKDAVCDRFRDACGERPSVATVEPDMRIFAFLTADRVTLYLDTSGEALFKRGYRKEQGIAPLRENLAAGILRLAGWQPGIPLLDPMCGSGTFLIEAAMMALNIAPGIERWFAFEKLKNYDEGAWKTIYEEAVAAEKPKTSLPIHGSDKYGSALDSARANLEQAGLEDVVHLKQVDALEISAPEASGYLITNPPYGERLGDQEELAQFYPRFGDVLKQRFGGWNAYIITADLALAKLIRLSASRRIPLYNGALDCRLFEYKLVAGSNRKEAKPERPAKPA